MSSESEEETEISSWQGVPGTVILINALDNTSEVALAATTQMIRHHLRESNSYCVGVCLYGIEGSKATSFLKGVIDIFPLTTPTLDEYDKLQKINISTYTLATELILSDALWHCSKMFASCKKKLSSCTVIILSRLHIPPVPVDQKPTLERVKDLVDSYIEIKIVNISKDKYKADPFYEKFLCEANKGVEGILPEPIWDCKAIQKLIYQQSHRHLAIARLKFDIGEGMTIGIGVYGLLKKPGYSNLKKVNLDEDNNKVSNVNKTLKQKIDSEMDIDNEEQHVINTPVMKSELIYYQEFGGEKVTFSDTEMKNIKNLFGPPMMKLLGFKPAEFLCKEKWFLKTCNFLYPTENIIEGSTVVFRALHKACVEMKVVAICVLCTRVNSRPNIVALSPCTLPLRLGIEIGFDVIYIPFVENLRNLPSNSNEENNEISDAHKTVMRDILDCLKFDFKADMFENPKLQSEYRAIETKALNEDLEPFVDTTKLNESKCLENIKADLFEELFGPFDIGVKKTTKRDETSTRVKGDIDENTLQNYIRNKTLAKCTVQQLKDILRSNNNSEIPALTGMKKNDLVDLVYKYCSNK